MPQNDRVPIIPVTILASASINASDAIVVELVEADETPAVVISRAGQADHLSPAPLSLRRGCCSRVLPPRAGADPQGAASAKPS